MAALCTLYTVYSLQTIVSNVMGINWNLFHCDVRFFFMIGSVPLAVSLNDWIQWYHIVNDFINDSNNSKNDSIVLPSAQMAIGWMAQWWVVKEEIFSISSFSFVFSYLYSSTKHNNVYSVHTMTQWQHRNWFRFVSMETNIKRWDCWKIEQLCAFFQVNKVIHWQ